MNNVEYINIILYANRTHRGFCPTYAEQDNILRKVQVTHSSEIRAE